MEIATATPDSPPEKVFDPRKVQYCLGCGSPLIASPLLKCREGDPERYLRSFYYKRGSGYAAECIDLDLMSLGPTPEDAIGGLQEAVFGYLEAAFNGDPTGLVMRPSPLSRRVHYYCNSLLHRIKHLFEAKPPRVRTIA